MSSLKIYELAKWYVDKAAELTGFHEDSRVVSFIIARKYALLKWTTRLVAHHLGERYEEITKLRRAIVKILGEIGLEGRRQYYALVDKLLSTKLRAIIEEDSYEFLWNAISDYHAFPERVNPMMRRLRRRMVIFDE